MCSLSGHWRNDPEQEPAGDVILVVVLEVDSMIWFSKRIRFYLIHICLLTMRTEGILYLLVWDVISVLNSHSIDEETALGVLLRATTVSYRPQVPRRTIDESSSNDSHLKIHRNFRFDSRRHHQDRSTQRQVKITPHIYHLKEYHTILADLHR